MKALTVLTLLGAVTSALGGYLVAIDKSLDAEWNSFKDVHGKTYLSPLEEIRRRSIWQDNRRRINEHNAQADLGLRSYRMAVNQFADMTIEEIKMKFDVPIRGTLKNRESQRRGSENLPDSLDWEKEGYVTPVKDQGQFGSPVSFAVTGSIEGVLGIRNRRLTPLAYQQIQDCYKGETISGAFESVIKLGGIMSESAYSNSTQNGTCHFDREKVACRLATYKSVDRTEEALENAVANVGPITIAINAEKFYFYASGIFDDPSCAANGPNHALLVTGYGSERGLDYWRLKNSWGTSWGENGYIRIKRNANTCNIAGYASYPVLA